MTPRPLPASWEPTEDAEIPWWASDTVHSALFTLLMGLTALALVLLYRP